MGIEERWRGCKPLPPGIKERLHLLTPLFEEGVLLVYLFGSLLKSEISRDVDLAVLPAKEDLGSLREKVYEALDTLRIDLVNLKTASPLLRFEVIKTGVLIYKKDEGIENDFELNTIKEYRDTIHLRKMQAKMLEERINRWS